MAASSPQSLQLTVLRRGDVNIIDLAEVGSLISRNEVQVDDDFLTEVVGELDRLTEKPGPVVATAAFRALGGLVFSHLLTEGAREQLREAGPHALHLRLDEQLVRIPWELAHDGDRFLGEKFCVARQVITREEIPRAPATAARSGPLRVLLVAAAAEAERGAALDFEAHLSGAGGVEVSVLHGPDVRRLPLLAALGQVDVACFFGDLALDDDPGASGWPLGEGHLAVRDVARLAAPPPLVVHVPASCPAQAGTVAALGRAVLVSGIPHFVGEIWTRSADAGPASVGGLITGLARGGSLAEAFRAARPSIGANDDGRLPDLVIYGDPASRLREPGDVAAPAAETTAPEGEAPSGGMDDRPPVRRIESDQRRYAVRVDLSEAESARADVAAAEPLSRLVVGRQEELGQLDLAYRRAAAGDPQVVFVDGPPGIGKTTLVDAFIAALPVDGLLIGRGQSVEQYGAGEAYLPILEAWTGLCRRQPSLRDTVAAVAPLWRAQMPSIFEAPQENGSGPAPSRARMMREMGELALAVSAQATLVLVLEDLHWSDRSTIDLLGYLGERRGEGRLLVIGTHRPLSGMPDHPLRGVKADLEAHRRASSLRPGPLAAVEVERFLRERFPDAEVSEEVGSLLYERTDGHPLFLTALVDFLVGRELLLEDDGVLRLDPNREIDDLGVPESVRHMIVRQLEILDPVAQTLLSAASVVGQDLSAAAVAAAIDADLEQTEEQLDGLAQRSQLLASGGIEEWPDGTVSGRYRFVHALYRNTLYDQVPEVRRVRMHRRVGERKEQAYGGRAREIAGELASHFEAGRDGDRAITWHCEAGDSAVGRFANFEALSHYSSALGEVQRRPPSQERDFVELVTRMKRVTPLMATAGYASRELEGEIRRARTLSNQVEPGPYLYPILRGFVSFLQTRSRHDEARELGSELLARVSEGGDILGQCQAHYGQGVTLFFLAEQEEAEFHLSRALDLYDREQHLDHVTAYGGYDPGVASLSWTAWLSVDLGRPDQANEFAASAVDLAEGLAHPFSIANARLLAAVTRAYCLDPEGLASHAKEVVEVTREHDIPFEGGVSRILEGWALVLAGDGAAAIGAIEEGIAAVAATGARLHVPVFHGILASAYMQAGRFDDSTRVLDAAMTEIEATQQPAHLVHVQRERGCTLAAMGDRVGAERAFRAAMDAAERNKNRLQGLHAAVVFAETLAAWGRAGETAAVVDPWLERVTGGRDEPLLTRALRLSSVA